jgi:hypothetical protein
MKTLASWLKLIISVGLTIWLLSVEFDELIVWAKEQMSSGEHPGLGQDNRVLHRGVVKKHVAVSRIALDHMLLITMNQGESLDNLVIRWFTECRRFCVPLRSAEPGFVIETDHVDDQCIPLPVVNGVSVVRGIHVCRRCVEVSFGFELSREDGNRFVRPAVWNSCPVGVPKWDQLPAIPAWAKIVAAISLLLWVGAILAGVEVPALSGMG